MSTQSSGSDLDNAHWHGKLSHEPTIILLRLYVSGVGHNIISNPSFFLLPCSFLDKRFYGAPRTFITGTERSSTLHISKRSVSSFGIGNGYNYIVHRPLAVWHKSWYTTEKRTDKGEREVSRTRTVTKKKKKRKERSQRRGLSIHHWLAL